MKTVEPYWLISKSSRLPDGHQSKGQQKNHQRCNAQPGTPRADSALIVNQRMPHAKEEKQRRPNQPTAGIEQAQRHQCRHEDPRQPTMPPAGKGVKNVPAVQLPDRQQIERGGENTDPGCPSQRMQIDVGGANAWQQHGLQQSLQQRDTEYQVTAFGHARDYL